MIPLSLCLSIRDSRWYTNEERGGDCFKSVIFVNSKAFTEQKCLMLLSGLIWKMILFLFYLKMKLLIIKNDLFLGKTYDFSKL